MPSRLNLLAVLALCLTLPLSSAAAGVPLATYRAVHDLILDPAVDAPEVGTMTGRLVTEFKGSECAGYTTTTRFVTEAVDSDGDRQVIDARSVTVEKPDGSLKFDNETYENGTLSESSKGTATRSADGVRVALTDPTRKTINLSGDMDFPLAQVVRTLEAGRAGERFLSLRAYDGLDAGETVSPATVVIGAQSTDPSDVGAEAPIADAGFATLPHWPVTITYFDEANGTDQAPQYGLSAILYDNGIMRKLRLDYRRFALVGTLVKLDVLPPAKCP